MATLEFTVIRATLFGATGKFESKYPGVSFKLSLVPGESIKLESGHKFEDLECSVAVVKEESGGEVDSNGGSINFFEGNDDVLFSVAPSCTSKVYVTEDVFNSLLSASISGALPSKISIETEGMEFDWQPDGSGKIWNNVETPRLPITRFRFETPLAGLVTEDEMQDTPALALVKPGWLGFTYLSQQIEKLMSDIQSSTALVKFLLLIITIAVSVEFFI